MKIIKTLVFCLVLLTACAPAATPEPEAPPESSVSDAAPAEESEPLLLEGMKIASAMPGPINDAGFSAAAYAGLMELKDTYGADVAYTDRVQTVDAEAVLEEYAKNGYDIVMAHGYEFDDAMVAAAEQYPDVIFAQIDGAMVNDTNLYSFGYHTGEGGYLLGLIAGSLTESKKIGLIGGTEDPAMVWEFKSSRTAILSLVPDAEVLEVYVGSWDDPAKCKELAQAQIEAGVDQLIVVTDGGDLGAVEAAQEAYDAGLTNIRVISWGQDKWELAPDILISGWNTSNAALMVEAAKTIIAGKPADHYVYGLQDGVVFLHPFHGLVPPEVEALINQAIEDYKNGELEIEINDNL